MKKSLKERIKALPTFLKSETMKKYGISFIAIILCMLIIAYVMNIWMGLILTLFVILLGTLLYSFANYIIKETFRYGLKRSPVPDGNSYRPCRGRN